MKKLITFIILFLISCCFLLSQNPYDKILIDDYRSASEKRNQALLNPKNSYNNNSWFYALSYDPMFYNIIEYNGHIWVEPIWLTTYWGYSHLYYNSYYNSYSYSYYNNYYSSYWSYYNLPYWNRYNSPYWSGYNFNKRYGYINKRKTYRNKSIKRQNKNSFIRLDNKNKKINNSNRKFNKKGFNYHRKKLKRNSSYTRPKRIRNNNFNNNNIRKKFNDKSNNSGTYKRGGNIKRSSPSQKSLSSKRKKK